jgi:Arc/MetJ family transcription regulator
MRYVKVELELDQTLLDEVMRRHHMRSPREAVNLALRSVLAVESETDDEDEDENDPFGLAALDPHHHHRDAG